MSFPKMKLGECAEIHSGSTPRTNNPDFWDGDITWVTPKDLSKLKSKFISKTESKITQLGFDSCSTKLLPENSVLFSSRAPIGHVAINTIPMCTNQGFKSFVPKADLLDSQYLYYWLKANKEYLQDLGVGATFKEISKTVIANVEIPLPPLAEQRRIASILDQADELRQKRQQAIEKLDQLLQATFIDMFGDPVSNPKGWDLVRVGEVVNEFIGGKNIECPDESDSDYKILKVSAVTSKVYKPHESKFAPNTFEPNPLAIVEKGDLLFSRANTTELVAATAYVWETPENIVLPDKLWKFSISDESKVNKLYLWDLFKNIEFRNELSKLSSGTSGSMKNISKGKLNELKMPLPPKELQDKFAEFSTKLWVQIKTFQQSSDSLDSLFNSLQNQAFNGTL